MGNFQKSISSEVALSYRISAQKIYSDRYYRAGEENTLNIGLLVKGSLSEFNRGYVGSGHKEPSVNLKGHETVSMRGISFGSLGKTDIDELLSSD